MKNTLFVLFLCLAHLTINALDFNEIDYWVGQGSNQAAIVIDWQDAKNPQSLVWGYRFDGTTTALDMIAAISQTDERLNIVAEAMFNNATYDLNNDGTINENDHNETLTDNSFWSSYFLNQESQEWEFATIGIGARVLNNGDADAWVLDLDWTTGEFPTVTPPTPAEAPHVELGFDDITYWFGNGSQQAGLVVDFNDSQNPEAFIFGINFDYPEGQDYITGQDLFNIVATDDRIEIDVEGGFLDAIRIDYNEDGEFEYEQASGTDWWSTWSNIQNAGWNSNSGVGSHISNNDMFGCSYGFSPAQAPANYVLIEEPTIVSILDDITYWFGSGSQKAGLVVDFNDSQNPEAFVFGVQFDLPEGQDHVNGQFLLDVVSQDPRFSFVVDGGLLEEIYFDYNEDGEYEYQQLSGSDWWSTWSNIQSAGWGMNGGISSPIQNYDMFGCSYGFSPTQAPADYVIVSEPTPVSVAIATNDTYTVRNSYEFYLLPVLANDTYENLEQLNITMNPQFGNAEISDNHVKYMPRSGFTGIDSLEYAFSVTGANSNNAKIYIHSFNDFVSEANSENPEAIHYQSDLIAEWASAITVQRGWCNFADTTLGRTSFGVPENGMQVDENPTTADVVSLGDFGEAILTFNHPITNGAGYDFAVYENAFGPYALELAFVEVSSDGINYKGFRTISNTPYNQQTNFNINAKDLHNIAGKYPIEWGTGFNLDDLVNNEDGTVDANNVTHVKVIDVCGIINNPQSSLDYYGSVVNDPYPTWGPTGGFDLSGVAALNIIEPVNIENDTNSITCLKANNYPNPFNPSTTIKYSLPNNGFVNVSIYNVKGQKIKTLVNSNQASGHKTVVWNGKNNNNQIVSSGIYYYKIQTKSNSIINKMLMVK